MPSWNEAVLVSTAGIVVMVIFGPLAHRMVLILRISRVCEPLLSQLLQYVLQLLPLSAQLVKCHV